MRNHFGHVFSFIQKDCRISDPAAALKEGIYIVNVFKTKGRGAVALANIFCWAAALLYAQMASKSVTFSMPFFINAVHSQASLSACLISGCFVFNYQNLCPF